MKELFRFENATKSFDSHNIIDNVNLTIYEKERIAICGPSGVGKTTLLRCINLLDYLTNGSIYFKGQKIIESSNGHITVFNNENKYRTLVGMVFQQYNLWHNKTIIENIIEGLVFVKKVPKEAAIIKAKELCELLDIEYSLKKNNGKKYDKYPSQLSGGQQQRVALARALAMEPEVLLLDEITSALDPPLAAEVLIYLKKINEVFNITLLIVTHYIEFAKSLGSRFLFMKDGKITIDTPINELDRHNGNPEFTKYLEPMKVLK
jgi:ABC-type polar amino acid transport system ATPase subunit